MRVVSILVAVYNAESFVEETVQSVLAQTYPDWELLLVDDGSTDGTPEVLSRLARLDTRIRVLRQPNAGTQVARNYGLRHCHGEWVALLDHDDVWLPRKLERQLDIAREHPDAGLLFCNYVRWDGSCDLDSRYTVEDLLPSGVVLNGLAFDCLFGALTVMVRRDELLQVGGFDIRFLRCGDWDLWLRLAEKGIEARGTIEVLARWRIWAGNLSGSIVKMRREEVLVLQAAVLRASTNKQLRDLYKRSLEERRGNLLLHEALDLGDGGHRLAKAALGAWIITPKRLRLLKIAFCGCWPELLGGRRLRQHAKTKILRRY